jgi:hypothetical protein
MEVMTEIARRFDYSKDSSFSSENPLGQQALSSMADASLGQGVN